MGWLSLLLLMAGLAVTFENLIPYRIWRWLHVRFGLAVRFGLLHLPFLNLAFGTVPLSVGQWGVCVAMASGVLWFGEGRKLLRRHWTRRAPASPVPGGPGLAFAPAQTGSAEWRNASLSGSGSTLLIWNKETS